MPDADAVKPAMQTQSQTASLPAGASEFAGHDEHWLSTVAATAAEYLPAPQSMHATFPLSVLYLPAAHCSHVPDADTVKPATQMQSETAPLPAGAYEFAGHAEQVLSAVAATAAEYLPAPQSVHAASPASALYLPATHG